MMPRCVPSRVVLFAAALVVAVTGLGVGSQAATLERIGQSHTVRIAYRADAPPFSYMDRDGTPAGFMVDLCNAVVKHLAQQLGVQTLNVSYVTVTAADRFEAIAQGKADLLCEPTSTTLARRKLVDFSVATFVDGASLMIGPDGPTGMQALAGRSIGVLAGTTTEQELKKSLTDAKIAADVIPAKTHAEGLAMLDEGKISAYFGDRAILLSLMASSKDPGKLRLADAYLTIETYALALPRGDEDFRLEVDRALSHIYGSGEISAILTHTFGANFGPEPTLRMIYLISGLPD
jgi:ABC-type amino acid transport substrate-binding protein